MEQPVAQAEQIQSTITAMNNICALIDAALHFGQNTRAAEDAKLWLKASAAELQNHLPPVEEKPALKVVKSKKKGS